MAGQGDEVVLTVVEVAALLRVSRDVVYEEVARGRIPHRRFGRLLRFHREEVLTYLRGCSSQVADRG